MKYNQNTQFKLQVNQRIKHLIESKSSDQGEYLLIKNFDPGRGWFYRYYESDYPLLNVTYTMINLVVVDPRLHSMVMHTKSKMLDC